MTSYLPPYKRQGYEQPYYAQPQQPHFEQPLVPVESKTPKRFALQPALISIFMSILFILNLVFLNKFPANAPIEFLVAIIFSIIYFVAAIVLAALALGVSLRQAQMRAISIVALALATFAPAGYFLYEALDNGWTL